MKTRIGEKTSKTKITGLRQLLKAYPGAAVLAGLVAVGGIGFGAMTMIGNSGDELVLGNNEPAIVEEQKKTKETTDAEESTEVEEVIAKTTDEAAEDIVAAGAESAVFTAKEEGMTVDIVLPLESSEEDVNAVDSVAKELLTDLAFISQNLFENTEEKLTKSYNVNYLLGEDAEEASYLTTATYTSGISRKGGMLYVAQASWSGPEAVKVEEAAENGDTVVAATTTPAANTATTAGTTTPATNDITGAAQTQTETANSTTTTTTQNQLTATESAESIAASSSSLKQKAKNTHNSINSDVVGWMNIPGTGIDYPVTHTNNNTYYMNHNIYKQSDRDGALVADYECNFSKGLPTNTIVYGHNWHNYLAPLADSNPNDSMFDEVHKYADATFASNHPYIYFSTTEKDYKYQVFAAFYTNVSWTDYIYAYPNNTKFSNVLKTAKNSSVHNFGVNVSTSDKIITLSTCTRMMGNTNQYRFVVMGKLVG